jgi:thiamine kinase-like enzyme
VHEHIHRLIQLIPELRGRSTTVTAISGGLTNRNYRIDTDGESYVLRVAGENTALLGIDRECEAVCARTAAELGVGPEVVSHLSEHEAMLTRFVPGQVLAAHDIQQPAMLRRVVAALRRYHNGRGCPGRFSPFATVRSYHALARDRKVALPESLGTAFELLARIERELQTSQPPCPCHNDLLAANFIDDGRAVKLIDWEYSGMGDRFFDLGNLAVNNEFDERHELSLLELYFGEIRPGHLRRLRLMRLASDMREAMWGFLQAAISDLNADYLSYGRKHLERFLAHKEENSSVGRDSIEF